jgi:hypothetical protein
MWSPPHSTPTTFRSYSHPRSHYFHHLLSVYLFHVRIGLHFHTFLCYSHPRHRDPFTRFAPDAVSTSPLPPLFITTSTASHCYSHSALYLPVSSCLCRLPSRLPASIRLPSILPSSHPPVYPFQPMHCLYPLIHLTPILPLNAPSIPPPTHTLCQYASMPYVAVACQYYQVCGTYDEIN